MATEAATQEPISEILQHIVQSPFDEVLHPEKVGTLNSSKGDILVESPIGSAFSIKENVQQYVEVITEEIVNEGCLKSKGNNIEVKDGNAQPDDKDDEAQGGDIEKLDRVNEDMHIKVEAEDGIIKDESTTETDSISGAETLEKENIKESIGMIIKEDLVLESPIDLVPEEPESDKLERVNEEMCAKLEDRSGIIHDETANDIDSISVAELSEKESTKEHLEVMANEGVEPTKDELELVELEGPIDAAPEEIETKKLEKVNEDKHVELEAGTAIFNDEGANNIVSILVEEPSEKRNMQEPLEIIAKKNLEPARDGLEYKELERSLDAVSELTEAEKLEIVNQDKNVKSEDETGCDDVRTNDVNRISVEEPETAEKDPEAPEDASLKVLLETPLDAVPEDPEAMSKDQLVVNVEESTPKDEKDYEPNEKAAPESLPEDQIVQNKMNEGETNETATSEQPIHNADDNVEQTVRETEEESIDNEAVFEYQSQKKIDAEITSFSIPEDGDSLEKTIDTLCTSKASMEENKEKETKTEETREENSGKINENESSERCTQGNLELEAGEEILESIEDNEIIKSSAFKDEHTDEEKEVKDVCKEHMETEKPVEENELDQSQDSHEEVVDSLISSEEFSTERSQHLDKKQNSLEYTQKNDKSTVCGKIEIPESYVSSEVFNEQNNSRDEVSVILKGTTDGTRAESTSYEPDAKNEKEGEDGNQNDETNERHEEAPDASCEDQAHEIAISKDHNETSDFNENTSQEVKLVTEPEQKSQGNMPVAEGTHIEKPNNDKNSSQENMATDGIKNDNETANKENRSSNEGDVVKKIMDGGVELHEDDKDPVSKELTTKQETEAASTDIDIPLEINSTDEAVDSLSTSHAPKEYSIGEATNSEEGIELIVEKNINEITKEKSFEEEQKVTEKLGNINELEPEKESSTAVQENASDETCKVKLENLSKAVLEKSIVSEESTCTPDLEKEDPSEENKESFVKNGEASDIIDQEGARMNTEDLSYKPDPASAEDIHEAAAEKPEETPNSACEEQTEQTINASIEMVSNSEPEENSQEIMSQKQSSKIFEKVEPNDEKENEKNEANLNKGFDENPNSHATVVETINGEIGQENGEGHNTGNGDQIHQATSMEDETEVNVSEAEEETEQLTVITEPLPEDKCQNKTDECDAIKIDSGENEDSFNRMVSADVNMNKDVEIAMESDEVNLNTEKGNHSESSESDSDTLIVQVLPHQVGEHEDAPKTECDEQLHDSINDKASKEVDMHKDNVDSEEPETVAKSEPMDHIQRGASEPYKTDNSGHTDKLDEVVPEIVHHNDDRETAKMKDEDVQEKGIGDVIDTPELMDDEASDGVGKKHEDAHHITATEDNKEAEVQEEKANLDISSERGPQGQRQDAILETESDKGEKALNLHEDANSLAVREENASDATSRLYVEETGVENNYVPESESDERTMPNRDDTSHEISALNEETGQLDKEHEKAVDSSYEELGHDSIGLSEGVSLDTLIKEDSIELLEGDSASTINEQDHEKLSGKGICENDRIPEENRTHDGEAYRSCVIAQEAGGELQMADELIKQSEKEEATNCTDKENKDDELVSQLDKETVDDALNVSKASLNKSMQNASIVLKEKMREDNGIEVVADSENENKEEQEVHTSFQKEEENETKDDVLYANEASLDKSMQNASIVVEEKIHTMSEDNGIEVVTVSDNENKEEPEGQISFWKEEENEIKVEHIFNESCDTSETKDDESFKEKEIEDNNSEIEGLEDQELEKLSHVVLEDLETVNELEVPEGEIKKQYTENDNEENIQKGEDKMLGESAFELQAGIQTNMPIQATDVKNLSDEAIKEEVVNASLGVSSNIGFDEPAVAEVETLSQQMTVKEQATDGADEEAKDDAELASRMEVETMRDTLYATEASLDKNIQDATVMVEEKIHSMPEDNSIEVRVISENENKEEQDLHTSLQKEELEDEPHEKDLKENEIRKSYDSCDICKTNENESSEKETAENNTEKEILENQAVGKSTHVNPEDLETAIVTEFVHESETNKQGIENDSENFQKGEVMMLVESALDFEPGDQSNNSMHTNEGETSAASKEEGFDACPEESSNIGFIEPIGADTEHLSQQMIEKKEAINGTDEEAKDVELVSRMDIKTVDETLCDKNMEDTLVEVEDRNRGLLEEQDNRIEVGDISENKNKNKTLLQIEEHEDKPQGEEHDIQTEQKSYELCKASDINENESLTQEVTAENNSDKQNLEDQEPEKSPNMVLEDLETANGTDAIHESETNKQGAESNNEGSFSKDEDSGAIELAIDLEPDVQSSTSIQATEKEIPSEEALKEEALDARLGVSSSSGYNESVVAEIEDLAGKMQVEETVTNRTDKEEAKDAELVSQTYIETTDDTLYTDQASFDKVMENNSAIVEEKNNSTAEDNSIEETLILENGDKQEQDVHARLQIEDLGHKQENEYEMQREQIAYGSCEASETDENESIKENEIMGSNSNKVKSEDQQSVKSAHVVLEDLETVNGSEDIHESETEKQGTESVVDLDPDNQSDDLIHNAEEATLTEETIKEEVSHTCLGESSHIPIVAEVKHISRQMQMRVETIGGTNEDAKDNELVSEGDTSYASESSLDKNTAFVVVEDKTHSAPESNSIEARIVLEDENKEEQDLHTSLQKEKLEDKPQEKLDEIHVEQNTYGSCAVSETNGNESFKEEETAENNSDKENFQETEKSPHMVLEDQETESGTEAILETEKQGSITNNEDELQKGGDKIVVESTTDLEPGDQSNKSIQANEGEISYDEALKEEVSNARLEVSSSTGFNKSIAAEVEHLPKIMQEQEEATNGADEEATDAELESETCIQKTEELVYANEASVNKNLEDASTVVEAQNHRTPEDNNIEERVVLANENKEEKDVHTSLQIEKLEDKSEEKEYEIKQEQKSNESCSMSESNENESSKENESAQNNSDNEKLEDREPEISPKAAIEDVGTVVVTEDIHESKIEKQGTEVVIELEPGNQSNNSDYNTGGENPSEETSEVKGSIDDVPNVDAPNEENNCKMVGKLSVTHELIEESKDMEGQGPNLQNERVELETPEKAEPSDNIMTQNEEIEKSDVINIKLQEEVKELMQLEESSSSLSGSQEVTNVKEEMRKNILLDEEATESACEQNQEADTEVQKNIEPASDTVPSDEVEQDNCQSSKEGIITMDPCENLDISSIMMSPEETKNEANEKFSKISDYWPGTYNEASNADETDTEPSEVEKLAFTSDLTEASGLHAKCAKVDVNKDSESDDCKGQSEKLKEVSNLVSKELQKIDSSMALDEDKESRQEQSAVREPIVDQAQVIMEPELTEKAIHEVGFDNSQEEKQNTGVNDLPVSQFLMKHILQEEGDTLNRNCDEEHKDAQQNDVNIPKQEKTSMAAENVGFDELQNINESVQAEESYDVKDNSEVVAVEDDASLPSTLEDSTSRVATIDDKKDEVVTVASEISIDTAIDDNKELISTEKRIQEIEVGDYNKINLVPDEKIQEAIFEETVEEKDIGNNEAHSAEYEGRSTVDDDKLGKSLENKSEVTEIGYGEAKQDVGNQVQIMKNSSEEELKPSEPQKDQKTDSLTESTVHPLEMTDNLLGDKISAVGLEKKQMVVTTDDRVDVNKTDEEKYQKEEEDGNKFEKSGHIGETAAEDSELKPIQKCEKPSEPFTIYNEKFTETLEIQSEVRIVESMEREQAAVGQIEVQTTDGSTESQEVRRPDLVKESPFQPPKMAREIFEEQRSVAVSIDDNTTEQATESRADEGKTDDEKDENEEDDEHKPDEPGNDATVAVEGRDAELTPSKKKSHGILSGVGSKVKHSIAKVKKAITGKSSHSKTQSAK